MNKSFVWYESWNQQLSALPADIQQKFITAIIAYGCYGTLPDFGGLERAVWISFQCDIDSAQDKYSKKADAGRKGGSTPKQNKANESNAKQVEATESKIKQTEANESKPKQNNFALTAEANESTPKQNKANESNAKQTEANGSKIILLGKDIDIDDDIDIDADADVDTAATAPDIPSLIKTDDIDAWLIAHGCSYDDKTVQSIKQASQPYGTDYLDYVRDRLKDRNFDGQPFTSKPFDQQRSIFRDAVINWHDLRTGFDSWYAEQIKLHEQTEKQHARASPPKICPDCGAELTCKGETPVCSRCNAFFEFDSISGTWTKNPYAVNVDLSAALHHQQCDRTA